MLAVLLWIGVSAGVQNAPDFSEPICILQEVQAQESAGKHPTRETAIGACKARYGWTDAQAQLAMDIVGALSEAGRTRDEATSAGVDPVLLDKVFDAMRPEQMAAFGTLGRPGGVAGRAAARDLQARLAQSIGDPDGLEKAVHTEIMRAIATNMMAEFTRQRTASR